MNDREKNTVDSAGRPAQSYPPAGPPRQADSFPPAPPPTYSGQGYGYGQYRPYEPDRPRETNATGAYYQYGTNSGWQRAPRGERYQWNFEALDNAQSHKSGKRKSRGLIVFAVLVLCVLTVTLLSLVGYGVANSLAGDDAPAQTPQAADTQIGAIQPEDTGESMQMQIVGKPESNTPDIAEGQRMTIPQVAQAVRPSVVGVISYTSATFFEPTSEGSGIIMSEDGYIVTNAHVVAGADALVVVLSDGEEIEAALIGEDARTDLAVLKVEKTGLPAAVFGDSDQLEVGETVIAIGNPAGLEFAGSVTQGIVSAVNRVVKTPYYSMNYIQTDAAINPGNSGGALANEFGQVVGINSSKIVAEGYEGISFAIPITEAKPIIDDLIRHGRVTGRVLLGITGEPISEIIARNYNVPAGVQITSITSEELTRKGVLRGDIITHIDEERVWDLNDVRAIIERHQAGDVVTLTLYRQTSVTQNQTFEVEVTLIADEG